MKKAVYFLLIAVSVIMYFLWKMEVFPVSVQKFMSNYGMHGVGGFAFTLAIPFCYGIFSMKEKGDWILFVICLTIGSTLGITFNEFLQLFKPDRVFDLLDIGYQVVGCAFAGVLLIILGPIDLKGIQVMR